MTGRAIVALILIGTACTPGSSEPPSQPSFLPDPVTTTQPPGTTAISSVPVDTTSTTSVEMNAGDTACNHPYQPLRLGAYWRYDATPGALEWEIIEAYGDDSNAEATMEVTLTTDDGAVIVNRVFSVCGADGITRTGAELDIGPLVVTTIEGVELPPADLLVPGYSWTHIYDEDRGPPGRTERTCRVASAGTAAIGQSAFDTLTLECTVIQTPHDGSYTIESEGTEVWGLGLGVFSSDYRGESEMGDYQYTKELVEWEVPADES